MIARFVTYASTRAHGLPFFSPAVCTRHSMSSGANGSRSRASSVSCAMMLSSDPVSSSPLGRPPAVTGLPRGTEIYPEQTPEIHPRSGVCLGSILH